MVASNICDNVGPFSQPSIELPDVFSHVRIALSQGLVALAEGESMFT